MLTSDTDERIDCRTVADRPLLRRRYVHPNAKIVGTCYDGCCDEYECPDCGTAWTSEGPDY